MSIDWTPELKKEVVEEYTSREPTPENSMDIVKELAEEYEKTANGIRMILTTAGVYIKKAPAVSAAKKEGGSTRVNKAESITALSEAISALGLDVQDEILSKLTGKAANYFISIIKASNKEED